MSTVKYIRWQEEDAWLGYLQGETLDDLKMHLRDLYQELSSGVVPGIRKVDAWEREIEQRLAESDAGRVASVPWEQVPRQTHLLGLNRLFSAG